MTWRNHLRGLIARLEQAAALSRQDETVSVPRALVFECRAALLAELLPIPTNGADHE